MSQEQNIKEEETIEQKQKKKKSYIKWYFILILILIIGISAFTLWFNQLLKTQSEAKKVLKAYETLVQEKNRCADYLSQKGGDFSEYEYCKKLLNNF